MRSSRLLLSPGAVARFLVEFLNHPIFKSKKYAAATAFTLVQAAGLWQGLFAPESTQLYLTIVWGATILINGVQNIVGIQAGEQPEQDHEPEVSELSRRT